MDCAYCHTPIDADDSAAQTLPGRTVVHAYCIETYVDAGGAYPAAARLYDVNVSVEHPGF